MFWDFLPLSEEQFSTEEVGVVHSFRKDEGGKNGMLQATKIVLAYKP